MSYELWAVSRRDPDESLWLIAQSSWLKAPCMDLLERGLTWLEEQRRRFLSCPVSYRRGIESVEILATRGRSTFEQVGDVGQVIRVESQDFIIAAADLVLGGEQTLPRAGDRIVDATGTFEVVAPAGVGPYQRDAYGQTLRIHTQLIG